MSKLKIPESWAKTTLDEMCDGFQYGANASASQIGDFRLLRITDLADDGSIDWQSVPFVKITKKEAEKYLLKAGDVVIARSGSIGKTAILNDPPNNAIFASYLIRLKLKTTAAKFPLLSKYFISPLFQEHIRLGAKGAAQTNINTQTLRAAQFVLPPLGEQERIVAKIESTQEQIKNIEQGVTKAEELIGKYREALLQKAFRGELVPQDPNDEPASQLLERIRADRTKQIDGTKRKKDDLPPIKPEEIPFEIPKSWEWVRLGELLTAMGAGWSPKCENYTRSTDAEWGVLKLSAISWGTYKPNEHKALPRSVKPKPEFAVEVGQLLISRANTRELVARSVLVTDTPPNLMLSDLIIKVICSSCLDPTFMNYFNNSKVARAYYERVAKGASSTMCKVSQGDIQNLPVPLPPLGEQKRIARYIESNSTATDALLTKANRASILVSSMSNAILRAAFSGRLVLQDPTEGTGHSLLEQFSLQNTNINDANSDGKAKDTSRKQAKS